jgi:hypothetical protein
VEKVNIVAMGMIRQEQQAYLRLGLLLFEDKTSFLYIREIKHHDVPAIIIH